MLYNNQKTAAGQVMPLLMGCTAPSPIETEDIEHKIIYDPISQKVVMNMRYVGTYSLKARSSSSGGKIDRKNEIDDQKFVK